MQKDKDNLFLTVSLLITAVLITAAAIIFHQSFLRIIPLYVSLFVGILQSKVNRYSFLIGGINCVIYSAVYVYYGIYGTAASTFFIQFPVQIFSFINWGRHSVGNEVTFRWFTPKKRAILATVIISAQLILLYFLHKSGAKYVVLDSIMTVLGIVTTILAFVPYIEYTISQISGAICSLILYILMLKETPEQATYLVFTVFSLICIFKSVLKANKLYRVQRKIENENSENC